uniref:Metal ABC transporter ATP-binding protein n=1 Tax=Geoglobus ahangari TaxID=113653 RepID=A0A7C3YHT4_9EURY
MMITAENVHFSYKEKVLENVNFKIDEGEFVAILGPNGAGKTTLLKLIMGLLRPDEGVIRVFGYDPARNREKIAKLVGYLPQREVISLDLPLTVRQVLSIPFKAKGIKINEEKLIEALSEVNLQNKLDSLFSKLSGGQQQRILLARALIGKPKLLLLDEPFNGVDVPSQEKIVDLLNELAKKGTTVIVVVHNINLILHHVTKVMLLNRRIIAFGEPNDVFTEENIVKAYGSSIPLVICEEGYTHPLYGDHHG